MLSCAEKESLIRWKAGGAGGQKNRDIWILKPAISNGTPSFQGNEYAFSDVEARQARAERSVPVVAGRSKGKL